MNSTHRQILLFATIVISMSALGLMYTYLKSDFIQTSDKAEVLQAEKNEEGIRFATSMWLDELEVKDGYSKFYVEEIVYHDSYMLFNAVSTPLGNSGVYQGTQADIELGIGKYNSTTKKWDVVFHGTTEFEAMMPEIPEEVIVSESKETLIKASQAMRNAK